MLFANVCEGFIRSCYGNSGNGVFWAFWLLFCVLCVWGASLASPPVAHKTWVSSVCLLLDTPSGRRSVEALPL